jgi:Kef-type K+ transport system membrane component KefB
VLLGPSLLGWIEPSQTFRLLAEIGINLLLFEVGLIFAELERVNDILVNNVYVTTIIVIALTTLLPLRAQGILQSLRQPILRGELTVWQSAEFIMF